MGIESEDFTVYIKNLQTREGNNLFSFTGKFADVKASNLRSENVMIVMLDRDNFNRVILSIMLTLRQITLSRGNKILLDKASVTLHEKQKIGLVGHNGCGKSSLFSLILGELSADTGECLLNPQLTNQPSCPTIT